MHPLNFSNGNAPGNMRFYYERVPQKLIIKFEDLLLNFEDEEEVNVELNDLVAADRWILSKLNTLAKEVTENMDKYELGVAVSKLYDFFWEEFCDWYIEMVKPRLYNKEDKTRKAALWTLKTVLINALKLLHPYMPFITEEIFTFIQDEEETIMLSVWPTYKEEWNFSAEENEIELMKQAIRNIRNLRAEMNVPPSKKAKIYVVSNEYNVRDIFNRGKTFFSSLAYASELVIREDKSGIDDDAVSTVIPGATIFIPFTDLVDISKEIERLENEKKHLEQEIERVNKKLNNKGFVEKAPQKVVEEERQKGIKYETMYKQVNERLEALLSSKKQDS